MIDYKIEIVEDVKSYPVMLFSDPQYSLMAEFLLAERSFLKKIKRFVKSNDEQFSGNAFTLYQTSDNIEIESDFNDSKLQMDRQDFYSLLCAYYEAYKKTKK